MKFRKQLKYLVYNYCPGLRGSFIYDQVRVYFPRHSHIFKRACAEGIYENRLLSTLAGLLKDNSVYIDVGANIGLMSIPILRHHKTCQVWSFEPSPNTLSYLNRTVEGSRYRDRWRVIGKAAGAVTRSVELHMCRPGVLGFRQFGTTGRKQIIAKNIVEMTTLDLEWEAAGCPQVSVIKIDAEGADLQVLLGARRLLDNQRSAVVFEWNEKNFRSFGYDHEDLCDFAAGHRLEIIAYPVLPASTVLGI